MNIKKFLFLSIIGIFLVGGGILFFGRGPASATPFKDITIKEWPPFVMIYKVLRYDGSKQTVGLQYDDKKHWRVEILTESVMPETVGAWSEYDGTEIRHFDPFTGITSANRDMLSGSVSAPEEWLRQVYVPKLLAQSNTEILDEMDGVGTFIFTEYLSCDEDIRNYLQQEGRKPCTVGVDRVQVTEIKYRTDYNIPLSIVDTIDGEEVRRITVTELTILDK